MDLLKMHLLIKMVSFIAMLVYWRVIVGLEPGGLDSWDPLIKGMINLGYILRIQNHRDPNQQLPVSWLTRNWGVPAGYSRKNEYDESQNEESPQKSHKELYFLCVFSWFFWCFQATEWKEPFFGEGFHILQG